MPAGNDHFHTRGLRAEEIDMTDTIETCNPETGPGYRNTDDAYLRMSCLQQACASREVERGDDPVLIAQRYYDFVTGSQK